MCVCARVCSRVYRFSITDLFHTPFRATYIRETRSVWVRDLRSRANISREHAQEKKKEGSGRNPECCLRVPVGDNLKVRKGESIRYTGKMKSRGRGGGRGRRKNGARTGYRITVYRTNISLLLDQTFFFLSSLFLSFPLSFPWTPDEGETRRERRDENE